MRKLAGCLAIALLAAAAGPVSAAQLGFVGALHLDFLGVPPLEIRGAGVAGVNPASPGIALRTLTLRGGITGSASVPFTDPEVTVNGPVSLRVDATLGSGTLAPFGFWLPPGAPLLTANTLPVAGLARLCLFFRDCSASQALTLTASQGAVGLGVGGLLTAGGFGPLQVSVQAAPWTVGEASLPLVTPGGAGITLVTSGWVHGPLSFTGSTALPGGALSLVTPLQVQSPGTPQFGGFARLEVRFVPEPGRLSLLTSGLLSLVWLGRRRMRR